MDGQLKNARLQATYWGGSGGGGGGGGWELLFGRACRRVQNISDVVFGL